MPRIYKLRIVPSVSEYVTGRQSIRPHMNAIQLRLLSEHYHAPNRSATTKALAHFAGIAGGHTIVNAQYGRLGHMFCDAMHFTPEVRPDSTYRWWAMWSLGYSTADGFVWQMLPEVATALELLDWVTPAPVQLAEEVTETERFFEGALCRITINAYERNPSARAKCIQHYGLNCAICDFNFGTTYGIIAEGYIHVHHIKPLSQIGIEYEVDPIADLRPVCPNCHAMIHLGGATRSIEEVRRLLQNRPRTEQSLAGDGQ